jgi:hypothetical protein
MKVKTILILAGICLALYVGVTLFIMVKKVIKENSNNPMTFMAKPPIEYLGLFNFSAQQKLNYTGGGKFKLRNAIFFFDYDNYYNLEITKINCTHSFKPGKDIVFAQADGEIPNSTVPSDGEYLTSGFSTNSPDTVQKLYLSLQGDSIKTIKKNDTLVYYYLEVKNAYVQYHPKGLYQIYMQAKPKFYFITKETPVIMMFFKQYGQLYYLCMTPKETNTNLDPDLLYSAIEK